jgi:hypothetical protein
MADMQPAPEQAPAQGGDLGQAVQMVGSGLEQLIAAAPSPEVAQALQGVQQQLGQILAGGGAQPEQGPVSPETAGQPVVPAG